jgi:predicted Zn-dependent protease
LLKYTKSVDEMAHILGHELSHLILGHSSLKNLSELGLNATEVLLLSIDPSAGAITFLVVGVLATISKMLKSGFSRECEQEADQLGVELATLACYDAKEGSKFMYRLSSHEHGNIVRMKWMESHPPSIDRARDIFKQASEIQQQGNNNGTLKCDDATCKAAQQARVLYDVWHSSPLYGKLAWELDT